MIEYIKKSEALQAKNEFLNPCIIKETSEQTEYARAYNKGWNDCNSEFIDNIERIAPTADVQEVKHGKWITHIRVMDTLYQCSICAERGYVKWYYCPYCGAKMDGDEK